MIREKIGGCETDTQVKEIINGRRIGGWRRKAKSGELNMLE